MVAIGLASTVAVAAPDAPAGWSVRSAGRDVVYAPDGRRDVELRIHAPVQANGDVASWFAQRIRGLDVKKTDQHDGVQVAMASDGRRMMILVGCKRSDGFVYGELTAPHDADVVKRYANEGLALAMRSCTATVDAAPAVTEQAPAAPSHAADVAAQIDTVVVILDSEYVGTTLTYVARPLVLFRGGDATSDRRVLAMGIAAHKRAHADAWSKWRRVGKTLERSTKGRWERLRGEVMTRLPRGFTLAGRYRSESYSTNPNAAYASWNDLTFDRNGRFHSGAGMGGVATAPTGSTGVRNERAKVGGSYTIDGYLLTLRFDNGSIVHRTIVADAQKPERINLDGTIYRR
jgi:hypothetical protein